MIDFCMETVTLTIDGQEGHRRKRQDGPAGGDRERVFPFRITAITPRWGVDGSCRVCIVKIEKMPKLQTACSTICTEGIVDHQRATPDVIEARAGVFEFLLINHPLDCPVCDKGGECPLQDFCTASDPGESRMEFPRRVFDGEGVEGRRRLRSHADAEPQSLHPLHAVRPVHEGD